MKNQRSRTPTLRRWAALSMILALLFAWADWQIGYAHLSVVQAKKLTVRGKPAVQLLIQTDQGAGKEVIVQVGANKITFQTDARGRVDTGHMEIPAGATTVEVRMPAPGDELWPAACTIPLAEIPQDRFERVTACLDLEPPVTRFSQSPGKNAYGWNRTPVEVTLEAADAKSGVKRICYELSGAISQGQRCVEGAKASFTIGTSPNGTTTVRFFAEDRWVDQGTPKPNREEPKTDVVRIDTGAPSISGLRSPEPNANGWNNGPVRVEFHCSDALSGIAGCSGDRTVSSEGANQSVTGSAEDRAGNTNSTTVYVNIDLTRPTVRQAGSATCSLAGNAGWCRGEITVPFEASDNLSGFAPDGRRTTQFERSTSQEGESVSVTGAVEDLAGNPATPISAGPFAIDRTGPRITLTAASSIGEVSLEWSFSDDLSGLASCLVTISGSGITTSTLSNSCSSGRRTLTFEEFGAGSFTVHATAQDGAGNESSDSRSFSIERPGDRYEPNDTFDSATRIEVPANISDLTIEPSGDVDFFVFRVPEDAKVTVDVDAESRGSSLDPTLTLFDENRNSIAANDDTHGRDPFIETILSPGVYFIQVKAYNDGTTGPYTLHIDSTAQKKGVFTVSIVPPDPEPFEPYQVRVAVDPPQSGILIEIHIVGTDDFECFGSGRTESNGVIVFPNSDTRCNAEIVDGKFPGGAEGVIETITVRAPDLDQEETFTFVF